MVVATVKRTTRSRPGAPSREKIRRCVGILQTTQIWVGIPDGVPREDSPSITQAQLLFIQEHGVRRKAMREEMARDMAGHSYEHAYTLYVTEHGSPLWAIPPRPVLEPALAKDRPLLMALYGEAARKAWRGIDPTDALALVAEEAAAAVHDFISDPHNGLIPNAPETVKRKGSDRPLIDKGSMLRAIVGQLRRGKTVLRTVEAKHHRRKAVKG